MSSASGSKQSYSFDEYKLYYESTEKVTERRLGMNRWNYSICTAIFVAVAALTNWAVSNPAFFVVGVVATLLLCGIAILFCFLWIGQIRDFKALNNAKFEVMNEMAPHVAFDLDHPECVSACPFDKEWKKLQQAKALTETWSTQIVSMKSSNVEYFIPKAFIILFTTGILAAAGLVIYASVAGIPHPEPSPNTTTQASR